MASSIILQSHITTKHSIIYRPLDDDDDDEESDTSLLAASAAAFWAMRERCV